MLKPGDCSVVELPLSIPNREVKHYSAENTFLETELEDRSLPGSVRQKNSNENSKSRTGGKIYL